MFYLRDSWQTRPVLTYLKRVPFGVWFGAAILILAARTRDELGLVVGVVLIVVTTITTSRRDKARERAEQAELEKAEMEKAELLDPDE